MKATKTGRPRVRLFGWPSEAVARIAEVVARLGEEVEDLIEGLDDSDESLADSVVVARHPGILGPIRDLRPDPFENHARAVIVVASPNELEDLEHWAGNRPNIHLIAEPFEDSELIAALRMAAGRQVNRSELMALKDEVRAAKIALDACRRDAKAEARRRTQFLAAISHDLRTPLWEIALFGQVVQAAASEPSPAIEWNRLSDGLLEGVAALRDRVEDLFSLATLDLGAVEYRETKFLLAPFLDRVMTPLRREAEARGLAFIVLAEPPWAEFRTDAEKLARVLQNLVSNALKFTTQGEVRVWARIEADGSAAFTVSDTGKGIDPESLISIFDEFAQIHNPERDRLKGTGLGLPISRRLVECLGGVVSAKSELGRGSEFAVRLPLDVTTPPS